MYLVNSPPRWPHRFPDRRRALHGFCTAEAHAEAGATVINSDLSEEAVEQASSRHCAPRAVRRKDM